MSDWRILVLDEDPLALELYTRELERDYVVTAAPSIAEARPLLKQKTFEVLILEPATNEDEGWTLLKEMRLAPNPPRIILISIVDERKKGLELGAEAFLVKPVLPLSLHSLLDRLVARQSSPNMEFFETSNINPLMRAPQSQPAAQPVLEIKNLKTYFFLENSTVRALDGIDLTVPDQSTVGVVGESGCGKSVMSMSIMRLIQSPPGKIVEGEILLNLKKTLNLKGAPRSPTAASQSRTPSGVAAPATVTGAPRIVDIAQLDPRGSMMRQIRGGEIAMIFQEPMTSLNPLYRIGDQIIEAVKVHQNVSNKEAQERALEMLTKVQISAPKQRINEYPHQLSGGMRQRVMIALALSCNPSILIADEPTTALDVTVQAQILDLMNQLQAEFGTSIIFISHNLGVVSQMARHVAVMYLGKIIELAETRELFHHPLHPYTVGLLNSVPVLGRKGKKILEPIKGMVPTPTSELKGCAFAPRCPRVMSICHERTPLLRQVTPGHQTACWLYDEA